MKVLDKIMESNIGDVVDLYLVKYKDDDMEDEKFVKYTYVEDIKEKYPSLIQSIKKVRYKPMSSEDITNSDEYYE